MMELTPAERLILINQYRILKALDPEWAEHCDEALVYLEQGYRLHYSWLMPGDGDELPESKSRFVYDVFDMFRALQASLRELDSPELKPHDVKFRGFDGNYETEYMAYARDLVEKLDLYQNLDRSEWNSHQPMVDRYRRMLAEMPEDVEDQLSMSEEQIRNVLEAGGYL